jgi:glycosyltransferase involved in cell wall biosynthesis
LAAWELARRDHETLVVGGTHALEPRPGVRVAGRLPAPAYRALLRRARLFVAAPRREDYGIAPLEALVDGCVLVTTPAPGPYPALELAKALDQRLVTDDLAAAIRTALDDPVPGYAARATELAAPFRRAAVDRTIAEEVLPRLLPGRM